MVRFPSDHSNRRDQKANQTPRFPSDSNAPENLHQFSSPGARGPNDRRTGGPQGGRNDGGQPRDNRSRDPFARERAARDTRDQGGRDARRRDQRTTHDRNRNAERNQDRALSELDIAAEPGSTVHIDPFELFCAYHLGITPDDGYRASNLADVARRFGVSPGVIKQALADHRMDPETLVKCDFDMAMAQIDIQVSPPGVSKTELARGLYEEFLHARPSAPSWPKPHAEEAEPNALVLGQE